MKDYSLRVHGRMNTNYRKGGSQAGETPPIIKDVTALTVGEFGRSISLNIGFDRGRFVLTGSEADLIEIFDSWIGCHVLERQGKVTWEGFIYMMDLQTHGDIDRRAILGVPEGSQMWNAVAALYTISSTTQSPELAANNSFEIAGYYGDVLAEWPETPANGSVTQDATAHAGSFAAKLVAGSTGNDTLIQRYATCNPGDIFTFSFYTRGDGTNAGRYAAYDDTGAAYIQAITSTAVTGTSYTQVTVDITAPAGCNSVSFYLMAPPVAALSPAAYFDSVSIKKYQDTQFETAYATQDQSIHEYGRKEIKIDAGYTSQTNAEAKRDRYLAERSWPWSRTIATYHEPEEIPADLWVYVTGYAYTMQYKYVSANAAGSTTLTTLLNNIISNDFDFLTAVRMAPEQTGFTSLVQDAITPATGVITERAGAAARRLVDMGDTDSLPYLLYVIEDRMIVYELLSTAVKYYRRAGRYSNNIGGTIHTTSRQYRPGVIRRMDQPVGFLEPGSLLTDRRDMLVGSMEIDDLGLVRVTLNDATDSTIQAIRRPRRDAPSGSTSKNILDLLKDKGYDPLDDTEDPHGGHHQ